MCCMHTILNIGSTIHAIDGSSRLKPDVNNEFKTREGWGLVMNNFSQMYA